MAEGRYKRNYSGHVIHLADCRRAGRTAIPWNYADGYTAADIAREIRLVPWLRPCLICKPDVTREEHAAMTSPPTPETEHPDV